jgi:hypothetical protein
MQVAAHFGEVERPSFRVKPNRHFDAERLG